MQLSGLVQIKRSAGFGFGHALHAAGQAGLRFTFQKIAEKWGHQHAIPRHGNCGGQQIRPIHGAELRVKIREARHRAGGHDGGIAKLRTLILKQRIAGDFGFSLTIGRPHIGAHLGAGAGVEINHALAAGFGVAELQRAHAANAAHEGVLHHLAEGGGKRGVEGIAAAPQDFCPYICRARLWADDNAFDLGHGVSSLFGPMAARSGGLRHGA